MAKLGGDYLRLYNYPSSELYHHGIKGQKWGVRRFQNSDGSLTNAGRSRYTNDPTVVKSKENLKTSKKAYKKAQRKADFIEKAGPLSAAGLSAGVAYIRKVKPKDYNETGG